MMRGAIISFMLDRFSLWQRDSINVKDVRHRKQIAEHAADTVGKAMIETLEQAEPMTARMSVYIQREAVRAYADKFAELLQADIEAAAQHHLLATLGPRVKALEDANNPALKAAKV